MKNMNEQQQNAYAFQMSIVLEYSERCNCIIWYLDNLGFLLQQKTSSSPVPMIGQAL